jgi:conflict system STAND superfamily ATPase/trypsin-like peptidase
MEAAVRGLESARSATVQVCDRAGTHHGQGLLLNLQGEGTVVLTCHHVIRTLEHDGICVRILQYDGQLGDPVLVRYDAQRSRPRMDVVVLHVAESPVAERPRPLLHTLNSKRYTGGLNAIGLTYLTPDTFDARVGPATQLEVPMQTIGDRSDLPERYIIPIVYRLSYTSDARPGISGGVILCEDGVLGLAHFARGAGPDQEREVYLVPLTMWTEGWFALAKLLEPLIDKRLWTAAKIKRVSALEIGTDVVIANYEPNIYIERKVEEQARTALKQRGSVVIIGRPKSGKTRLAWQLLQERPDALVMIPRSDQPPDIFEASSLVGNELVVCFDDLHRTAETSRVLAWRERLENESSQKCLVIITTRDGTDWKSVKEKQAGLLQTLGRDTYIFMSRGDNEGNDLSVDQGWQLAKALGMGDGEFDRRFDGTPGSLTVDLEYMRERYERLRDEQRGEVSMSRLLDSAKLLYTAQQPSLRSTLLKAIAEQIRGEGRLGAEIWERLCNRTREEGFGYFDSTNDVFQTYRPYLEECVMYEPSTEEVEALLPILINAEDYDGLLYLGSTLREKGRLSLAERACRVSIDGGNKSTYGELGLVLAEQPGREAEAEQAYRQAIEAGVPWSYNDLGDLLAE